MPYPLTNFPIQKYYQNEPEFNGIYTRNNLPKTKDGAHVIYLHEYKPLETYLMALCVNGKNTTYFWQLQSWIYSKRN